jgi:hypothetical protein
MFSLDLALTLTIVAATALYSARGFYRVIKTARSGCGNCGSCPFKGGKISKFKID